MDITIPLTENFNADDKERFVEIFRALVQSGGLSGVKSGKTIIHFDPQGVFRGIQLDYWPYQKRGG